MPEPTILVVDDQLINIRLLERKLERNGMTVLSATNGEEALEIANERAPDVILLDIMMPGMDGIEVCRHLKNSEVTRDIPVIFITARTSKEGKIEGLDVGAADYLIKPIDLDETIARVRTQIRIVQQHNENLRLTTELEQTRRQSAIMHLTEGIAHNLNNLLGVMIGYTSLLKRSSKDPAKVEQNCDRIEAAVKRMTRIVHQLTVIGHFKSLQTQPFYFRKLLHGAVARFHRVCNTDCSVTIEENLPEGFELMTNRELLEGALERLLQNAWESYAPSDTEAPPDTAEIILSAALSEEEGRSKEMIITVRDYGKGLDPEIEESIFEPFVSSFSAIGRGMGLTIVRHSANCLGGSVKVTSAEDKGTLATFTVPLHPVPVASDDLS
jgi:two-component system sensor histidine kinase/response regulator